MNIKPFRRKILPAIIGSVAISFGAANTFADSLMLEEVVVTAQKRAQNVQDVPIAITAFGGQRLEELGVVDERERLDVLARADCARHFVAVCTMNAIEATVHRRAGWVARRVVFHRPQGAASVGVRVGSV